MKIQFLMTLVLVGGCAAPSPALRAQVGDSADLRRQLQEAEQRLENAQQQVPVLERRIQDREQLKATYQHYFRLLQPEKERFKQAYDQYVFYLERIVAENASGRDQTIAADKRRVDPRRREVKSRWGGWLGVCPDWYAYGPYGKQYVAAEDELETQRGIYYEIKNRLNEEIRTRSGIGVGELTPPQDYDSLAALAQEQEGVMASLNQELEGLQLTGIPGLQTEIANLRSQLQEAERMERERTAEQDQPAPVGPEQPPPVGPDQPGLAAQVVVYEGPMTEELQRSLHELFLKAAQSGLSLTRDNISFSPMRMRVMPRERRTTTEPVSVTVGVGARSNNPGFKIESGDLDISASLAFSPGAIHEDGGITGTYKSQFHKRGSGALEQQSGAGSVDLPWRAVPEGGLVIESEGLQLPTSYLVYLGNDPSAPPMFRLQCLGTQLGQ